MNTLKLILFGIIAGLPANVLAHGMTESDKASMLSGGPLKYKRNTPTEMASPTIINF